MLRLYVEKRPGFDADVKRLRDGLRKIAPGLRALRMLLRYDIGGVPGDAQGVIKSALSEPNADLVYEKLPATLHVLEQETISFRRDERAEMAALCIGLVTGIEPEVRCATVYLLDGALDEAQLECLRARLMRMDAQAEISSQTTVSPMQGFEQARARFREAEHRDPTPEELRIIGLCVGDADLHAHLHAALEEPCFTDDNLSAPVVRAWRYYQQQRRLLYPENNEKPTLIELAGWGAQVLLHQGALADGKGFAQDVYPLSFDAQVDGGRQPWRVALRCGKNTPADAVRDALIGGWHVHQLLRWRIAGDPLASKDTKPPPHPNMPGMDAGEAANQFSAEANRLGVPVRTAPDVTHSGFNTDPLTLCAAIMNTSKLPLMYNRPPEPGDVVLRIGGSRRGRDVPALRRLQGLFDDVEFTARIKRCGAVLDELAAGLDVDLNALSGGDRSLDAATLLLAPLPDAVFCVVHVREIAAMSRLATAWDLDSIVVAMVAVKPRLRVRRREETVADIPRMLLKPVQTLRQVKPRVDGPKKEDPYPLRLPEGVLFGAPIEENWLRLLADINIRGQRGLLERLDGEVGGGAVSVSFGGMHRATPIQATATLLSTPGEGGTLTLAASGGDPALCAWSPYHGAVYAVTEAVAKVVAGGGEAAACRLALHARFARPDNNASRWGVPLALMLGAMDVQRAMGIPVPGVGESVTDAIGASPMLAAFAMSAQDVHRIITPELKGAGHAIAVLRVPRTDALLPDMPVLLAAYGLVYTAQRKGNVFSARAVGHGGLAAALAQMAFGNRLGIALEDDITDEELFLPDWGGLVLEMADGLFAQPEEASLPGLRRIGYTLTEPVLRRGSASLCLADAQTAWEAPLSAAFPTQAGFITAAPPFIPFAPARRAPAKANTRTARPRVCIPYLPGTTGEGDTARALERAGGIPDVLQVRWRTPRALNESLSALAEDIHRAQMLVLPGGFSGGDEPGGAGRALALVLRHPPVAQALTDLLARRDGLVLGLGNGFQALLLLGLLPYGKLCAPQAQDPALAVNSLGRHVAVWARTVVSSALSPWMAAVQPGEVCWTPVSCGQGRFICADDRLRSFQSAGQIVAQYCDARGTPVAALPANPTGSDWAVESLCSPDGRVLGKMGHAERVFPNIAVNLPGTKDSRLFASGVAYFS